MFNEMLWFRIPYAFADKRRLTRARFRVYPEYAMPATMESTKSVLEFLEQLRRERDDLNLLIVGLERRLGISSGVPLDVNGPAESISGGTQAPKLRVTIDDIPVGFFHNLSQPQAAEKLLRLNPGQPLTTPELLDAFRKSGMALNPKNATTILYTALSRNPKFERVAGKAWGLAEWYPESKRKPETKKADAAEAEGAEDGGGEL